MSTEAKTLNPEEAYNVLVAQVHAPVFFEKLARVYGITPQNDDEAREMLLMAGQLRNAHEQQEIKNAEARANDFATARKDLQATLAKQGFHVTDTDDTTRVKQAADDVVGANPLLREAALVFGQFMQAQLNPNK